jgi:hypothetical protein
LKKYRCPHKIVKNTKGTNELVNCNNIMTIVSVHYLNDDFKKIGLECKKHPGITYRVLVKADKLTAIGFDCLEGA